MPGAAKAESLFKVDCWPQDRWYHAGPQSPGGKLAVNRQSFTAVIKATLQSNLYRGLVRVGASFVSAPLSFADRTPRRWTFSNCNANRP